MNTRRNNTNKPEEKDELLREGRRDDERFNPFEQASQNLTEDPAMEDEAEAEQQHKEAMTERD